MARAPQNSSKLAINSNYAYGGTTVDYKLGIPNSFYSSRNLDFRSIPSQMSVLPAPTALSINLTDLITGMEQDLNGVRWGIGSKGNLYKIDTSNTITVAGVLSENGSTGILYNQITDQLYIPGQTKVSTYGQVTTGNPGQPRLQSDVFAQSSSINNGCNQMYNPSDGQFDGAFRNINVANPTGAAAPTYVAYAVPTTIIETVASLTTFSPDIEPGYSIKVWIVAKGTGNWTLTLHDTQNNALASNTIVNSSLVSGTYNEFVFGKQVRVLVGGGIASGAANYHFHLSSTVSDGTVNVVTASTTSSSYSAGNMQSIDMLWSAYRMVQTNNGWHPTALFGIKTGTGNGQALCIGNGPYLSTYNFNDDAAPSNNTWIRHQLVFKTGFEVCGLSTNNQYLVIAVERRSSNTSRNFQDGALYFWDGTTPEPTFVIDIPMGAPYGLYTFNNVTYFTVAGSLFAWSGGQTVIKVRKLAYQNTDYLQAVDHTVVNPNMFTSRYNLLLLGYPSSTTNPKIDYGNWSWGTVELTFPNSYGYSYSLSNSYLNNSSPISNLQIGCNVNFVDSLYTSWSYTDASSVTHYGLDLLDNFSTAATSGNWYSLIWDGGVRFKQKYANRLKISFEALPTGCTVTPFYIIDRGSRINGVAATTGSTNAMQEINLRFHEIQYGFYFTCPAGTYVPAVFTGVTIEIDPTSSEVQVAPDG